MTRLGWALVVALVGLWAWRTWRPEPAEHLAARLKTKLEADLAAAGHSPDKVKVELRRQGPGFVGQIKAGDEAYVVTVRQEGKEWVVARACGP